MKFALSDKIMMPADFDKLTQRIETLLTKLQKLEIENAYLKQRESKLLAQNRLLQEQQNQAETKITQVLSRLKSFEGQYEK